MKESSSTQTGYLNENFRLFHLKDQKKMNFDFHFHSFNKIIYIISGHVTYFIEGKAYFLQPGDFLLVNHNSVHRPIIDSDVPYERIVLWSRPEFMIDYFPDSDDLTACFTTADLESYHLFHPQKAVAEELIFILKRLEQSLSSEKFAHALLSDTYFLQFFIYLNRTFKLPDDLVDESVIKYDQQIEEILKYIQAHLTSTLTNEEIAQKFFVSKYYLMHKFKEETGYTLHNYIQQKRLLLVVDELKKGTPVMKAASSCGFGDYSSFLRAFQKMFHTSPGMFSLDSLPNKETSF